MSFGLNLGFNKNNSMSGSVWNPAVNSLYDFDYANFRFADSGVENSFATRHSFTRAAPDAYILGSDGVTLLGPFTTNVPRISGGGIRLEPTSTNGFPNSTFTGVGAGSPGTIPSNIPATTTGGSVTRTVIGTGVEYGQAYMDIQWQFSGASVADVQYGPTLGPAALSGESWTLSSSFRMVGGSIVNITDVRHIISEISAGSAYLVNTQGIYTLSSVYQRQELTRLFNNASTANATGTLRITASGAADVTVRYYTPQLEKLAFATSPIITSGAAVTRAADILNVSISVGSDWCLAGLVRMPPVSPFNTIVTVGSSTDNATFRVNSGANALVGVFMAGSVQQAETLTLALPTPDTLAGFCLRKVGGVYSASTNGGAVTSTTPTTTPAGPPTNVALGRNLSGGGIAWGDDIGRIVFPNFSPSDGQMQALSTVGGIF